MDVDSPTTSDPQKIERFFKMPRNASPTLIRIADSLKKQNNQTGFISKIIEKEGYAIWNKALFKLSKTTPPSTTKNSSVNAATGDSLIYIPLVLDDSLRVNAIFVVRYNDSQMSIFLYRAREYNQFGFGELTDDANVNAEKFAFLLMKMEWEIFGHTTFTIKDYRLFNHHGTQVPTTTIPDKTATVARATDQQIEICVYTQVAYCPYAPNCRGPNGTCDLCVECVRSGYDCQTATVETDFEPPVNDSPGGGGYPGTGYPPAGPYPCNPNPLLQNGLIPCEDGNLSGWTYVPSTTINPVPPGFNMYDADVVIIDTSIASNFPCVARILDSLTIYTNMNALAQVALKTIFDVNQKIHLTFKLNNSLGQYSDDGYSRPDSSYISGRDFYSSVFLNPWMLRNSTQEYIASTIIHESIHAFIDFKYYQYSIGLIDSTEFKQLFPIFWPPRQSNGIFLPPSNLTQHQVMASNLVEKMSEPLKYLFPNNSISVSLRDSIYKGLSWGGLQGTTAFQNRNDTISIKAINTMARDTTVYAPFTFSGVAFPIFTYDSHNLNLKKRCN